MGVKQGCPASPRVFCLFLDRVRTLLLRMPHPLSMRILHSLALLATFILLYADDLVLIADSADWLQ